MSSITDYKEPLAKNLKILLRELPLEIEEMSIKPLYKEGILKSISVRIKPVAKVEKIKVSFMRPKDTKLEKPLDKLEEARKRIFDAIDDNYYLQYERLQRRYWFSQFKFACTPHGIAQRAFVNTTSKDFNNLLNNLLKSIPGVLTAGFRLENRQAKIWVILNRNSSQYETIIEQTKYSLTDVASNLFAKCITPGSYYRLQRRCEVENRNIWKLISLECPIYEHSIVGSNFNLNY